MLIVGHAVPGVNTPAVQPDGEMYDLLNHPSSSWGVITSVILLVQLSDSSMLHDDASQVEYCFTSEGTDKRPRASSLRGLDAATYYRHNGVLNCGHAVVRQLVMDSLHHWADEYQVDGFCFVNAETLVQGERLSACCCL